MVAINLALQGGGAHGAFTWGVLDRLLDDTDIEVAAISATSAGAMNAAAFKSGWVRGEREGARMALRDFWAAISGTGSLVPEPVRDWLTHFHPPLSVLSDLAETNPAYIGGGLMQRAFSPYDLNPTAFHPLRSVVEDFDYSEVCDRHGPMLHIAATNVRSGKVKVFSGTEVTPDVLLASACLPTLYKAVEIPDANGEMQAYWDGGYMGNPALFPLFDSASDDILIVHINPIHRDEVPRRAHEIENRINEISFNATLLRELRAIDYVKRLISEGRISRQEKRDLNIHSVADDATMTQIGVATKLMPTPALIDQLFDAGRRAMDAFLDKHKDKLGQTSSCDIREMFQS